MFIVYADRSGQPLDLAASARDAFVANSFTHAVSDDGKTGTVTLEPNSRILRVGTAPEEYSRVRVFGENGSLVGAMSCSPYGAVMWSAPMWT